MFEPKVDLTPALPARNHYSVDDAPLAIYVLLCSLPQFPNYAPKFSRHILQNVICWGLYCTVGEESSFFPSSETLGPTPSSVLETPTKEGRTMCSAGDTTKPSIFTAHVEFTYFLTFCLHWRQAVNQLLCEVAVGHSFSWAGLSSFFHPVSRVGSHGAPLLSG